MNYLIDSIKSIHPVIEIHNFIFKGEPPKGHEYIANNAIHAGVIVGQGILNPKKILKPIFKLFMMIALLILGRIKYGLMIC